MSLCQGLIYGQNWCTPNCTAISVCDNVVFITIYLQQSFQWLKVERINFNSAIVSIILG